MNIHEYQAKALLKEFGVPCRRVCHPVSRRGDGGGREARRPAMGRQAQSMPAGGVKASSRKPRPATRAACASQKSSRGESLRRTDARPYACHGADRAIRQAGQPSLISKTGRHRSRALSFRAGRSGKRRGFLLWSRPRVASISKRSRIRRLKDHDNRGRSRDGSDAHHGRRVAKALELEGDLAKQAEKLVISALCGLRRQGHGDARNQSTDRDEAAAIALPRRQGLV